MRSRRSLPLFAILGFCVTSSVADLSAQQISTVVGYGTGDNIPAVDAALNNPTAVFWASDGSIYISDQRNHRIRKVDFPSGIITTVAAARPALPANSRPDRGNAGPGAPRKHRK